MPPRSGARYSTHASSAHTPTIMGTNETASQAVLASHAIIIVSQECRWRCRFAAVVRTTMLRYIGRACLPLSSYVFWHKMLHLSKAGAECKYWDVWEYHHCRMRSLRCPVTTRHSLTQIPHNLPVDLFQFYGYNLTRAHKLVGNSLVVRRYAQRSTKHEAKLRHNKYLAGTTNIIKLNIQPSCTCLRQVSQVRFLDPGSDAVERSRTWNARSAVGNTSEPHEQLYTVHTTQGH